MSKITSRIRKGPLPDPAKEKFWRKTLAEQRGSGLDVRAFCRKHALSEPSFHAWRRTIDLRDGKNPNRRVLNKQPAATPRPTFVELTSASSVQDRPKVVGSRSVHTSRTVDVPLEIVAGNRRVLIRRGCDRTLLREVLSILGD